jgi:hypothetical protein
MQPRRSAELYYKTPELGQEKVDEIIWTSANTRRSRCGEPRATAEQAPTLFGRIVVQASLCYNNSTYQYLQYQ